MATLDSNGIYTEFTLGEAYDDQMDSNLNRMSRFGFHLSIKSRVLTAPPGGEVAGDAYIPASPATGAWLGKEGQIAFHNGSAYVFGIPRRGWTAVIENEGVSGVGVLVAYTATNTWATVGADGSASAPVQSVAGKTGAVTLLPADAGADPAGTAAAAVAAHEVAADPHIQYQKESEKGVASGYASLDAGGTVPDAQIPAAIARDSELAAEAALARNADNLTSGTVADARIASTIARDSDLSSLEGSTAAAGLLALASADATGVADATSIFVSGRAAHPAPYVRPGTFSLTSIPNSGGGFWGPGKVSVNSQRFFLPTKPQPVNLYGGLRSAFAEHINANDVLTVVGDSIAQYAFATVGAKHWFNLLTRFINFGIALDEPVATTFTPSGFYGVTLGGTVTNGTAGPVAYSIILAAGASMTFTGAYEQVDVFYQQGSGAGTLDFAYNGGAAFKTINADGATELDKYSGPTSTGQTASGTYTITASIASVEITGLIRLGVKVAGSPPRLRTSRAASSGYKFTHFTAPALASIIKQAAYAGGKLVPIIALGTNDAVDANPAQLLINAKVMLDTFEAAGVDRVLAILPIRVSSAWPTVAAGYDGTVGALRDLYRERGVQVIPVDSRDFLGEGLLQDGLHPNDNGHDLIAQIFVENALVIGDITSGSFKLDNTLGAAPTGIVYKGAKPFISDFNYGNNGTVTTAGNNTFVGVDAGNLTMGSTATVASQASYNTFVGNSVGKANTLGKFNTAMGWGALVANTTGDFNTALGVGALISNTSGIYNSASGQGSLNANTTGNYNTGSGQGTLYYNTTGSYNTALGWQAGYKASPSLTTNSNCVFLGADANTSVNALTNVIAIGYQAQGTKSNQVVLGNSSIVETLLRGSVGIGLTPTAVLHLKAGTATLNTAPLKFTSGTLLTTPEAGAVEFLTDDLYATITTGAARKTIAFIPTQTDVTGSRALNTTYTNTGNRSITVNATVRCAITVAGGNAYVQGKSDTATPPTVIASGLVGIQAGLLNEDNSFQCCFTVAPGKTYILSSSATNGTVTLGNWFETIH